MYQIFLGLYMSFYCGITHDNVYSERVLLKAFFYIDFQTVYFNFPPSIMRDIDFDVI